MNYKTYYLHRFREDLTRFFSDIPDGVKHHMLFCDDFTIQPFCIANGSPYLSFLSKTHKEYFGVALFFTILVDMVCYCHYHKFYERFRAKTLYPKLIGNCLSACRVHQHPKNIFTWMNQQYLTIKARGMQTLDAISKLPGGKITDFSSGLKMADDLIVFDAEWIAGCVGETISESSHDHLDFTEKFREAILVMKDETISFFSDYLPDIKGMDFWEKCEEEFPFLDSEGLP
jgi:hypothetical protein